MLCRIEVSRFHREDNSHADALARLSFAVDVPASRTALVKLLDIPSIAKVSIAILLVEVSKLDGPHHQYLRDGSLLDVWAKVHKL